MEAYFRPFRNGIIGIEAEIQTPFHERRKIIYADWTASGRNYKPIEDRIQDEVMPLVGNTHSETSTTGAAMTYAYHSAREVIKKHVNAGNDDVIITVGSGMTHAVNKLQRIMGLKADIYNVVNARNNSRPVVFITHMEHHSNHISWSETHATVVIIRASPNGLPDIDHLMMLLDQYKDRSLKIAAITACSNVTGVVIPYHDIARIMHRAGGYCLVDFACSAPYVDIDMHPSVVGTQLDAIFFSPHKFLGGPGSSGVLLFNKELCRSHVPDQPGGGCVNWTDPRGRIIYVKNPEDREDAGTPGFLQAIKAGLSIRLKEQMGTANIVVREGQLLRIIWEKLLAIPQVQILAGNQSNRLGVISFSVVGLHYHLATRMLNDFFGIQCRGGCSCAGTYGHHLLQIDNQQSDAIAASIQGGDFSSKPGWIRISIHPTMTDEEARFIGDSVAELAIHHERWSKRYQWDPFANAISGRDTVLDGEIKQRLDIALWQESLRAETPTPHHGVI